MLMGVAGCLACLLILLLIIPIDIIFSLQKFPSIQRRIRVYLIFGLIRLALPSRPIKNLFPKQSKHKEPKVKRNKSQLRKVIIILKSKGFSSRLLEFISDMYKAMHIHILNLHFVFGLDDPADTGQLWAFVGPISNLVANLYIPNIHIEPDFMAETFYVEGKGEIRIIPIQVLCIIIFFILSPPVIRTALSIMTKRHI